jgi:E1A-binding protein p400
VFLSQELSTTVLTSATIRSLAASRALITELPGARVGAAAVPRHKLTFTLEPVTRAVGGWAVGGLGEGVSLVRAGNGQVYKVGGRPGGATAPASRPGREPGLGALHADSVETIAAVNRWRCDGYPLYGKDLIRSLTVTSSARPARSRFCGQGHVNCLVAEGPAEGCEREGVWQHRTQGLAALLRVGRRAGVELVRSVATATASPGGGSSALLSSLSRLLTPLARRGGKVVAVTAREASVSHLQHVAGQRGLRYLLVQGSDPLAARLAAVERWRLEPRICLLVLHGITSQTGLDLSSCTAALLLDSEPGRWEPQLPAAASLHRLATRGTVEEGLARVSTVRRLLADIEACRVEEGRCVRVAKQTLLELLQPSPDNGFMAWSTAVQGKKKDKGSLTDAEAMATLAAVWSEVTGSACSPGSCPLDLAELETAARQEGQEAGPGPRAVQLRQWLAGLRPAKRRGMRLLRDCWEVRLGLESETLREEEGVEERKRRWERKRKADEEQEVEDPSQLVTFPKELADRVWRSDDGLEPSVYRAPGLGDELMVGPVTAGYTATTIPEDELPPVHVPRREKKTPPPERETKVICLPPSPSYPDTIPYSPSGVSLDIKPKLTRRDEHPISAPSAAPRSLFDRPRGPAGRPTIARRPVPGTPNYPVATPPGPALPNKPSPLVRDPESGPEWTIQEDWALHQAVTSLQELPLSLTASSAGHIANWDMVADMVNAVSRCFRSAKQCRARYEGSLVPREEGRLLYDVTPKKIKKLGKLGMTKPEKKSLTPTTKQAMKTGALFKADNNNAFSTMFSGRFEMIKSLANKRTPSTKPLLVNPTMRNPKHAAVLAESGISYDAPLTPVMVAANRADRIAKEKARTAQAQLQTQPAVATPTLPTQVSSGRPSQVFASLTEMQLIPLGIAIYHTPLTIEINPPSCSRWR